MAEAGWYIIETDKDGLRSLAHWTRFPSERSCFLGCLAEEMKKPKWVGPLSPLLWDGERWAA